MFLRLVTKRFRALRCRQAALAAALLVLVCGTIHVGRATTPEAVDAAKAQAEQAADNAAELEKGAVALRKEARKLLDREQRLKADLAAAKEEVKSGGPKSGGWFRKSPEERLKIAEESLKEVMADRVANQKTLSQAEKALSAAQAAAAAAAAKAAQLEGALQAEQAAVAKEAAAKAAAAERLKLTEAAAVAARKDVDETVAKFGAMKQRIEELKKASVRARAEVTARTKLASRAEGQAEREAAIREMRAAETHAAAVSHELDRLTYDYRRATTNIEMAEAKLLEAKRAHTQAKAAYAPYAAAEEAAAPAAAAASATSAEPQLLTGESLKQRMKELEQAKARAKEAKDRAAREAAAAREREARDTARREEAAARAAAAEAREKASREAEIAAARQRAVQEEAKRRKELMAELEKARAEFAREQARRAAQQQAPAAKPAPVAPTAPAAKPPVVAKVDPTPAPRPAPQPAKPAKPVKISPDPTPVVKAPPAKPAKPAKPVKPAKPAPAVAAAKPAQPVKITSNMDVIKEREAAAKAAEPKVTYQGAWPPEPVDKPANARADEAKGVKYDVCAVVVTGDREAVYSLESWPDYENDALYAPMSDADIEAFRQRIVKDLQDAGYLFATCSVYKHSLQLGFLKLRVHVGERGDVIVKGNKWYSAEQILKSYWKTGTYFNQRELFSSFWDLNVSPDLRINTRYTPRRDADGRTVIDVEMDVEDKFPVHGSLALSNTGSSATSDWRLTTTLQHLNLTKHNDILTAQWITDPADFQDVNAVGASYYLPFAEDYSLTLFGGWSQSDLRDVVQDLLDVYGRGYYMGLQLSKVLHENDKHIYEANLGWKFQNVRNRNTLSGNTKPLWEREYDLSMPSLTIGYAAKDYDKLAGRNYWSNTVMANFSNLLGASDDDSITQNSPLADADFFIDRFQLGRFQKLYSGDEQGPGNWILFLHLDGQIASQSLPNAVQKAIGGYSTVRGYKEREVMGDHGVSATVELRTPIIDNFVPGLTRTEEYMKDHPEDWAMHRLQFVVFSDVGMIQHRERVTADQEDREVMASLGAGLRLGLTKYSQVRFDFGVPLESSAHNDTSGRGHLSLQLQF